MKSFKEYILIAFGIILVAISVQYFFAPNNLAAGGVTGLAIVIRSFMPSINLGLITLVLDAILFTVSYVVLGKEFGKRTIITGILFSVTVWVIGEFLSPVAITNDLIIASVFGAVISAFGMALIFNNNSTTGGSDIIAKIINKYTNINIGLSLLIVDILITMLGAFRFGIDTGFYAILSVVMLGLTIDRFIDGFNNRKEIFIISDNHKKISEYILEELSRGCTYINGVGVYTNNEIKLIYTIVERNEFIKLKKFIQDNDYKAFISVRQSYEVIGEGFIEME